VQKTWVNTYDPDLKFSGKEREGYSGLDYFGARYYDHKNYRFNSVDPIINREEALVNPQLWNLYAYCRNNPITYFDPDGMDFVKYDFNLGMWESDPGYAEAKYEQQKQQIRRIYTNLSLEAISGMMLMLPPVVATGPPPYFGTGPKNNLKTPKWVKDSNTFVNWMKNIQKSGVTVTKAQANKIVKLARKFGVKIRLDEPHTNTNWDVPHLNIGKKGQAHIIVPKGYKLPD
jgi:RHS repeat-associated protein